MEQKSLIYGFVARGNVILAEHTDFSGNFSAIAFQCLQKLPASNNKLTYICDGHTFNYLADNGFTYCVLAVESIGRQIPNVCLERIQEDFTKRYGGRKAATAAAKSLNKEFGPKLKEHMQYCVDHPEELTKVEKVKAQVYEVKALLMKMMEKLLNERGEKVEDLLDHTAELGDQAKEFKEEATQLRRKMWFQNTRTNLIVLGTIIIIGKIVLAKSRNR